jgi:Tfp pilus assembly protein PilF
MSNMGSVLSSNGKYHKAKELFETALKAQEAKYGKKYQGYINYFE